MPAALDAILTDTDSMLEVCAEFDSAKRSDGTLKTWYFSTHPRAIGAAETPENTEFLPFLRLGGVLGPLSQSLSEDILFNGLAVESPGTITLIQSVLDSDELSSLNDYVFAGYKVRIKIGRNSDLYAAFTVFKTLVVSIDPVVQLTSDGYQAIFQLSSALDRMIKESLIVKRHVGIPICAEVLTTTAVATTAYNAAHDVKTFTIIYRVRVTTTPAAARTLIRKFGSISSVNFLMNFNTTGFIECFVSLAGTLTSILIYGINLIDSNWHTIVWSLYDKQTSYLMVDGGTPVTYTPTVSVDLPAAGIEMARFLLGKHSDVRLYNSYMSPDEARSVSATRSDGLDIGCVGCWRMDDGGSATAVNDYSATNADATWTGVLNTAYKWSETDLGEPQLAGNPYPINVGNVLNAKAVLIDSFLERYRGNTDAVDWHFTGSNTNLTVRSQGTVLTGGGTDYTAPTNGGDGVFNTTTLESEPVTYDLLNNGTSEEFTYPSYVAVNLLIHRTRLQITDLANYDPLTILCPWPSGYYTNVDATAQQGLESILGGSGMNYYENPDGVLTFDMLLPPTGYGPFKEPVLDLKGVLTGGIDFGNRGGISGSGTVACWFKINLIDQTSYELGGTEPNTGTFYLAAKGNTAGNYALYFQSTGVNAGKLCFRIAGSTLRTGIGVLNPYTWYYIAGVFDDSANTQKIYLGPLGGTLVEVASQSNTGTPTTGSASLNVGVNGYSWGAVQYLTVFTTAKTLPQLQSLMASIPTGVEQGISVFAPINEGTGSPIEFISQTTGTILGSQGSPQWAPKLQVNLDDTPSVRLTDFHHTHPAWNIIINYAKNRFPMNNSDIDSGVSQVNRLALTSEGKDVKFESSTIRDRFKNAKKIVIDSPIIDQESAQKLLRVIQNRFSTDNYTCSLTFPPGLNVSRIACGLGIGDEIGLSASFPLQLNINSRGPRSFRVVACSPNPLQLSTNIVLFG